LLNVVIKAISWEKAIDVTYEGCVIAGYYEDKLPAERLKRVYEIATPRVRRYLDAEVEHVLEFVSPGAAVLELGCGYGRVLQALAAKARLVVGVDTSFATLRTAFGAFGRAPGVGLFCMDAVRLGFRDRTFDVVACIQNGISAFHADQRKLIEEAVRVTKTGATALFSSYSSNFWDDRLRWFERQAEAGLIGEIDYERTGAGVIVCKDGFTATTVGHDDFRGLTAGLDADVRVTEVDGSSVFCEITVR